MPNSGSPNDDEDKSFNHVADVILSDSTENQLVSKSCDESFVGGDGISYWMPVYNPTTVSVKYEPRRGIRKYKPALKHLLPVRVKTGPGSPMPVDYTGTVAFSTFSWLTPLVWKAFRRGLNECDLYNCSQFDSCRLNGARLSCLWDQEIKKKSLQFGSLWRILLRFIRTRILLSCFIYAIAILFAFLGPTYFTWNLLCTLESEDDDYLDKWKWMAVLILSVLLYIMFLTAMWAISLRTAIRSTTGLMGLLYGKLMRLRVTGCWSARESIGAFAADSHVVFSMVYQAPIVIGGPLAAIAMVAFSWFLLGVYSLVGIGVFIVAYIVQAVLSEMNSYFRKWAAQVTTQRVSRITELLTHLDLVKLYSWERAFCGTIEDYRSKECQQLEWCQFLHAIDTSISVLTPVVATLSTILVYSLTVGVATAAEAFTLLITYIVANHCLRSLPACCREFNSGLIALKRLQKILNMDEQENYTTIPSNSDHAVFVSKAMLAWDQPNISTVSCDDSKQGEINLTVTDTEKVVPSDSDGNANVRLVAPAVEGLLIALTDITFNIPRGELVGICGSSGSGKSSLLAALLGQLQLLNGQVAVRGSIAYVPREPWILSAAVRDNITFGRTFLSKRYYEAVQCCNLADDFASLPAGDQTKIGNRGVNLTTAQKQRVCLARALYSDHDLYLLDDPLFYFDDTTAAHVFEHCIRGAMQGKTILLVTNQPQYLQHCDRVLLMQDGRIVNQGSHTTLAESSSQYAAFLQTCTRHDVSRIRRPCDASGLWTAAPQLSAILGNCHPNPKHTQPNTSSLVDLVETNFPHGDLREDCVKTKPVGMYTYHWYVKAAGSYLVVAFVFVWFILQAATAAFSNYWLAHWISEETKNKSIRVTDGTVQYVSQDRIVEYETVYGLALGVMVTISMVLGFLFTKTVMRASRTLHNLIFTRVLQSPVHFFESIPVTCLLSKFARNFKEVDIQLPALLDAFLQRSMALVFCLLLIIVVFPWFVVALVAFGIGMGLLYRAASITARDLKQLENAYRSPVCSHINATIQGLPVICAYERQQGFTEKFSHLVDSYMSPLYLFYSSLRWLACRSNIICLVLMLTTALFAIFMKMEAGGTAFCGLAIASIIQVQVLLQYILRLHCDMETRFASVQQLHSFVEELDVEGSVPGQANRPPSDWPNRGQMIFRDVTLKYRAGQPLVLKGVTFGIGPQEKVGIVGLEDAEKSSIIAALYRLVELTSGIILIDGIDIGKLDLESLRTRLPFVPKNPIFFEGTIRFNLDPYNLHCDDELWEVLENVHMKEKLVSLERDLETPVSELSDILSPIDRHLLCIVRAILCRSRIVVVEEPVDFDPEMATFVNQIVQEVFSEQTVLLFAEHPSSVIHCDRVIVLANGKVAEFEAPAILMSARHSRFNQLMKSVE